MLKTICFNVVILFFLAARVSAQQKAQPQSTENSVLWQVSGKGLKQPSYLFGSYHLIGKDFIDTLPGISRAYAKASTVVGEILLNDPITMSQKMMPFMLLKDNSLDKLLSKAEYAEVQTLLQEKLAMDLTVFNNLKPAALQLTLVAALAPQTFSETNLALDQYFQDQAKKDLKDVIGLETIEQQAAILFNTPVERQKQELLTFVRDYEKSMKEAESAFDDYKAQNLEALANHMFKDDGFYTAEELAVLLSNRNMNWLQQLPTIMSKQSTFVVVGAGHLVGEDGLIKLLRNLGYVVEPLPTRN